LELSSDKTKREITNLLTNNEWTYQYSIFCDVSYLAHERAKVVALEWFHDFDDIKLRDYLRKTSDTAVLFIIRTGFIRNRDDKKTIRQVYLTMFCNTEINLKQYLESKGEDNLNVIKRKLKPWRIPSAVETIKKQKLHDLAFLGNKKRYSLINKKLLRNHQAKYELELQKDREYEIRHGFYHDNDEN